MRYLSLAYSKFFAKMPILAIIKSLLFRKMISTLDSPLPLATSGFQAKSVFASLFAFVYI